MAAPSLSPEPLDPVEARLRELVRPAARVRPLPAQEESAPRREWPAAVWPIAAAAMLALACLLFFVALLRSPQPIRQTQTPEPRHLTGGSDQEPEPKQTTPPTGDDPLAPYLEALKDLANENYAVRTKAQHELGTAPYEMIEPFKAWAKMADDADARAGMALAIKTIEMRCYARNFEANLGEHLFAHRSGAARAKALARHGGTKESEAAVERALKKLSEMQSEDGLWGADPNYQAATTGLVLLAFMGAGHTETEGAYAQTVKRGVAALIKLQQPSGFFEKTMYPHGIASWALAEAAGLSKQPATVAAAQKAVDVIAAAQNLSTGWRYLPNVATGDLSISAWSGMALFTARQAGLKVEDKNLDGVKNLFQAFQDPDGHFAYTPSGMGTTNMTFCGNTLRAFYKVKPADWNENLTWGLDQCQLLNPDRPQQHFLYGTFWGTLATFQQGGAAWTRWNNALVRTLLKCEEKTGTLAGTFNAQDNFDKSAGREATTAMVVLCLEIYYRYPRMSDQQAPGSRR